MRLRAELSAQQRAQIGDLAVFQDAFDAGVQLALRQLIGNEDAGRDLAPASGEQTKVGRLLIAGKIRFEKPVTRLDRRLRFDVEAERMGGDRHHVLSRGVASGVAAQQEHDFVVDHRLDQHQLAVPRRRFGGRAQVLGVRYHPLDEEAGLKDILEHEGRRAQHALRDHDGGGAAGAGDDVGAAAIGGDERRFRGRQRHEELAVGVDAVDAQGADHAERHLGRADEVLDVLGVVFRRLDRSGIRDDGLVLVGGMPVRFQALPQSFN